MCIASGEPLEGRLQWLFDAFNMTTLQLQFVDWQRSLRSDKDTGQKRDNNTKDLGLLTEEKVGCFAKCIMTHVDAVRDQLVIRCCCRCARSWDKWLRSTP